MAVSAAAVLLQTLCFCFFRLSSAGAENITAVVGENVTMTCKVLNNNNPVTVVDWTRLTRPDLHPDQVLLYRSNKFYPDLQHPSFQNRVDLLDLQKGDVSLILKNLKINDSGTYDCYVGQKETNRHKRDVGLICTINLSVDPSVDPSVVPSEVPSVVPSEVPSVVPSEVPSVVPSEVPSVVPSEVPSGDKHEAKEEEEDIRSHSGMYWSVPAVLAAVVFLICGII